MIRFWALILVALVSLTVLLASAFADSLPQAVGVSVAPIVTGVQVGQTLEVTATTLKHGSAYTDSWAGATKASTELSSDGYYVSKATFTAGSPGTHNVTYKITMVAGKSDVSWEGTGTTTITVRDTAPLKNVEDQGEAAK